jgi:signal transduction histidine kinase
MRGSRNKPIETVLDAMTAFLERDNAREAADILLSGMLRWTFSKAGFLGVVENQRTLRIISGGLARGNTPPTTLRISASAVLRRALQAPDVVCSEHPGRDFPGDVLLGDGPPLRNFILVPMHGGTESIAVAFAADRKGEYSPGDAENVRLSARAFGMVMKSDRGRDLRRIVEGRIRLAQKMEGVGRLAGGVAHDFNNLLTTILGQCDVLRDRLGGQAALFGELGEIRRAGERAASLTRQLLAFGRKQAIQPRILDLNEVVQGMMRDLQTMVGEAIEARTILSPGLGTILADRSQMRQVLLDLALNGRDAMVNGGKLTIETSNVDLDSSYVQEHPSAVAGPHVLMRVADTGVGMTPKVLEHVFEPFYTTKERGKANGLGLATVYGAIKQNGGSITVDSQPGKGTTIQIYLPRQEGPAKDFREYEVVGRPRGEEKILLVEDDAMVRRLVRETLRSRGYEVLEAGSAEDALRLVQSENPEVDLLLTDLVMPGLGGRELAELLLARRPGLPVLYMSGYSEEMTSRQGRLESDAAFLPKPFSVEELLLKVRMVIRSRA